MKKVLTQYLCRAPLMHSSYYYLLQRFPSLYEEYCHCEYTLGLEHGREKLIPAIICALSFKRAKNTQ